jgi:3-isopropylmalate/(R)-2-methylmalate dehydratase small subunit
MPLKPITLLQGTVVPIPGNDIDTDRIIPARFLKAVTFDDLADGLFYDERFAQDGSVKGHPIDAPQHAGASIVLTGDNFGCGSSREHAPQALKRAGYVGVIAGSFSEIFFGNATTLGMVCIAVSADDRRALAALIDARPATQVTIDVHRQAVRAGDLTVQGTIRDTAREALTSGYWDPIGELLEGLPLVRATAERLGYQVTAGSRP